VLLLSVPYALKAADAETLGGLPAAAFVHTGSGEEPASTTAKSTVNASANFTGKAGMPPATVTGSGTTDFIPLWTSSTNLGNSILFQTGGNVGVATKTPGAKLDTVGAAIAVRGTSSGATGTGVFGKATNTTGSANGVFGQTSSASGVGGLFQNLSTGTGAKILVAEDSTGTDRLSVDVQGNVNVVTGTTTRVKGPLLPINHARKTVAVSTESLITLDWAFPFPDTSYTATCSYVSDVSFESGKGVWGFEINSVSATSLQLDVVAYTNTSISIHCIGVHD